jgi:hypothetical protein
LIASEFNFLFNSLAVVRPLPKAGSRTRSANNKQISMKEKQQKIENHQLGDFGLLVV